MPDHKREKQNRDVQSRLAQAFSSGRFENVYEHMADDIIWNIVGENIFSGKDAVVAKCKQTAVYFNQVTTIFNITNSIASKNRVAINGTAEFIRTNKRVAFVSACDVYEFNEEGLLQTITSYCIPDKK